MTILRVDPTYSECQTSAMDVIKLSYETENVMKRKNAVQKGNLIMWASDKIS